ncbi:hypothetical protein EXIGLDRAFT_732875 [Exidia glandulosa HHB12029]|uniref:DUF6533 domain-containing protein n=1 Tax=Exidia glandulosa HHB12029 TaxID=1314781 RepID=A0A165PSU5_EXIGL|nr:hypothetical protein EXIGLDRAFT_732875 [Exidia glandulosa HHB12029]
MTDKQATASGYCKAAALAWLLYDMALTIDLEVNYIWRRRWTTFTALFVIVRYVPLVVVASSAATNFFPGVTASICDAFSWVEAAGTFIILVVVQVILQFRLYVMYAKSRRVLFFNALLCLVELGIAVALIAIVFPKTVPLPNSPYVFGSCFSHSPQEIAVVLLAPLAYETYLAFLALNKTYQTTRTRYAMGKRTSLMHILVRDNIAYFFLVAGTLIWVTLVWFFFPVSPGNSLISFTHVSGSIGGTRLILNVRRTALKPHSASLADSDEPTSAMELPVMRRRAREPSFHVTQGPSFGNLDADHFEVHDDHMDDGVVEEDDDGGFISPVDYGRPTWPANPKDSGVHLPQDDDRWAAISGRQDGVGKMLNALRSRP